MAVLLLQLAGPLQSWGEGSRFVRRETRLLPTKSGVLGLLAAALGRRRTDPLEDLAALRFGVRQDQAGSLLRDFQTAIDWRTGKSKPLSQRYYVSDAKYLAMVEGDRVLLEGIADAVRSPTFPLYLGRRACPPSGQLVLGVQDESIEQAIESAPWLASKHYRRKQPDEVRLLWSRDAAPGEMVDESVRDVPVSFDPRHREYGLRDVVHGWTRPFPNPLGRPAEGHDVFALLGGGS